MKEILSAATLNLFLVRLAVFATDLYPAESGLWFMVLTVSSLYGTKEIWERHALINSCIDL